MGIDSVGTRSTPQRGPQYLGGPITERLTPAMVTLTGNATMTAAQLAKKLIPIDCQSATAWMLPTAAEIAAALPGLEVGDVFRFHVINCGNGDSACTLAANTGITNKVIASEGAILAEAGHISAEYALVMTAKANPSDPSTSDAFDLYLLSTSTCWCWWNSAHAFQPDADYNITGRWNFGKVPTIGSGNTVVGTTAAQILTNKTLTSPVVFAPTGTAAVTALTGANHTITAAMSGTTFLFNAATSITATLPASTPGLWYKFVVQTKAGGGALHSIGCNASDKFVGTNAAGTPLDGADGVTLVNTQATAKTSDTVTLIAVPDGWLVTNCQGVWVKGS